MTPGGFTVVQTAGMWLLLLSSGCYCNSRALGEQVVFESRMTLKSGPGVRVAVVFCVCILLANPEIINIGLSQRRLVG
jgi:hypothetical protein